MLVCLLSPIAISPSFPSFVPYRPLELCTILQHNRIAFDGVASVRSKHRFTTKITLFTLALECCVTKPYHNFVHPIWTLPLPCLSVLSLPLLLLDLLKEFYLLQFCSCCCFIHIIFIIVFNSSANKQFYVLTNVFLTHWKPMIPASFTCNYACMCTTDRRIPVYSPLLKPCLLRFVAI